MHFADDTDLISIGIGDLVCGIKLMIAARHQKHCSYLGVVNVL